MITAQLLVLGLASAARVDQNVDLSVDTLGDTFCGITFNPAENSDTCPEKGDICCCLVKHSLHQTGCKSPSACKENGGECAEALWHPTWGELLDEHDRRVNNPQNYGHDPGPDLETFAEASIGAKCGRAVCPDGTALGMCARNRGVFGQWGAILSMSLGQNPKMRAFARNLTVWHWSSHYPASPYKSAVKRLSVNAISPQLKMNPSNCARANGGPGTGCCLWGSGTQWSLFLRKLNLLVDCPAGKCFNLMQSRSRFTFSISAPFKTSDLEFRCAQMESKTLNGLKGADQIYDLKSKHAFLNQFKDWVLYAGEMWFQPRLDGLSDGGETGQGLSLEDVMIVIDNNSGTMAPGGSYDVRKGIQQLLMMAFDIPEEQIQVCQGPFTMKRGMETWTRRKDPCPDNPNLYKVSLPEGSEAERVRRSWLQTMKEPAWSDHAEVVLELLRTGGKPKKTPGFAELQNEARTKAIPCEFLDDGSCGASCFCWTGCRQSCASQARVLAEGFALDFSGVAVGGGVVYARNCHLGGQRLCAAYVPN